MPCQVDGMIKVLVFLLFLCNIYYYSHDWFLFQEAAILQDCINLWIFMVFIPDGKWDVNSKFLTQFGQAVLTKSLIGQWENILVLVKWFFTGFSELEAWNRFVRKEIKNSNVCLVSHRHVGKILFPWHTTKRSSEVYGSERKGVLKYGHCRQWDIQSSKTRSL